MRKFAHFASTAVVALSLFGGVAAADTSCNGSINTTGTGSTNTVTCVDNNNDTVMCTNNVVITGNNNQSSNSGSSSINGNTTSGSASSGNAGNNNTSVVSVGASCTPVGTSGDFTVTSTPVASTPQVQSEQVAIKPAGAVAAGGGAGIDSNRTGLIAGVTASLVAVGAGLSFVLRKRSQI